ncbi:MAG: hypothetical protein IIC67_07445 [Thaumarchaeota archaeon]|nr:hypothetical protein [Nitrososphaerota archaeon]
MFKIPKDRRCFKCGSEKTYIDKSGYEVWCYDNDEIVCKKCYSLIYRINNKEKIKNTRRFYWANNSEKFKKKYKLMIQNNPEYQKNHYRKFIKSPY